MNIQDLRNEYKKGGLSRNDLHDSPFFQFEKWFEEAIKSELLEPNAMSLATVGTDGQPTLRTVLLKIFDEKGFVFFTNYHSKKAKQIQENDKVSLMFPWLDLERQVIITGRAEKISTAESFKYYMSRPKGSQLGAWVSQQSSVISSRGMLEMKLQEMKRKFLNKEIPLPDFWGGYRVIPDSMEFWQGRPNRLHDRFMYTKGDVGEWNVERLSP